VTPRSRRRDQDGPVVPPSPGALGVPDAPVGSTTSAGLSGAIRRWQQKRHRRRADLIESKANARENLKDFRKSTSASPWGGA